MRYFLFTLSILFTQFAQGQGKYPSILWEITKPGVSKPSYLFGTYHISNKGVFKLGDSLFQALQSVDIVAKEVNANTWQEEQYKMDQMENAYASYKGQMRELSITENTFKKTNTIEKLPAFMALTPNFINYFLYRNNAANEGFEEEMYLDRFISSTGYKYGKEIKGLENYLESSVLGIEGQKDAADQEKKEVRKIPGDISYREMNDKIYDGYLNNNLNAMDSFLIYQYESEAYFKKFIVERNYNQADSIDYYFRTGKSIFAAVGCAHLPGDEGVIEILRKKGYNLRPVSLQNNDNEKLDAVKKMIVPMTPVMQDIDGVISVKAPGRFYPYNKTDILKTYGYVDMQNGAYYLIARLYNNAAWFNYSGDKIAKAIDSLLYSSIKGNITSKKITEYQGMPCVDVTAVVKNKDVERYRMLITPYEIIKFQVGGKNNYAQNGFVDSFFNSINLRLEKPLDNTLSFTFRNTPAFHQWTNTSSGYVQNKQRYTWFDASRNQQNSCIKNRLPVGVKVTDSLVSHMVRESLLMSDAFLKTNQEDRSIIPLNREGINRLSLRSGGNVLVKYVIDYPVVYLLSSIAPTEPDSSFINSFGLQEYKIGANYLFTDTTRGFSVKLPFEMKLNSRWKYQTDRKRKQYDDNKDPNSTRNLFFNGSTYGNNSVSEDLKFEDINNMEVVELRYNQFDSSSYYSGPTEFWRQVLEWYQPKKTESSSEYSNNRLSGLQSSKQEDAERVTRLLYDTSSSILQNVYFVLEDSLTMKRTAYHLFLNGTRLYTLVYPLHGERLTAFQKQVVSSFEALEKKAPISIYQPKLKAIVKDYYAATKQKQPAVLNRLNNINLGIRDLRMVDSLFNALAQNNIPNNILRRKLMDMVADGKYDDRDWKSVSAWFQGIYNNKKNLATLRSFAVSRIINRKNTSDAKWLIEQFVNTGNAFQKRYNTELRTYLRSINPKKDYLTMARLMVKEKDDLRNLSLIDSGYFSLADRSQAFTFYKRTLEDENLELQISQESSSFQFNEKELDETAAAESGTNRFRSLLNGFRYFYSLNPKDPMFADAWKKIIESNSEEDMLDLLEIMLKQPRPEYDKISDLVKRLNAAQKNLYEINQLFVRANKYDKLADSLKNKVLIARYLLLEERGRYSKLDSLVYIGAEKFPYSKTDSVYFFKYIKERETNANIAYIVMDAKQEYLKLTPTISFTSEQVTVAEPYSRIVNKLMRRYYTSTYFKSRSGFYSQSNPTKSLGSEE